MRVARRGRAQRPEDMDLAGGVVQVIIAANHV